MQKFQERVWAHYRQHGRDLPWRPPSLKLRKDKSLDPYSVLVSEVMLQQTQVKRVIPKYLEFLELFPTIKALAKAPLADVIRAWSGLGYNRRAKYLHEAAKALASKKEPWTLGNLTSCNGIGFNTAAAVLTYAYNLPLVFVETNIRTVYIHHFFPNREDITDKEILPLVERTLDREHPREFMWALMDYGSFLKTSVGNVSRYSKHHVLQSQFAGSRRQLRGRVLRALGENSLEPEALEQLVDDKRLLGVLEDLQREGLISVSQNHYHLAD